MSFGFGGTSKGSQGFNSPRPDQTPKDFTGTIVNNESDTVYTVPTGKRVFINFYKMQCYAYTSDHNITLKRDATTVISLDHETDGQMDIFQLPTPLLFAAGEEINVVGSAAGSSSGNYQMIGWEENA